MTEVFMTELDKAATAQLGGQVIGGRQTLGDAIGGLLAVGEDTMLVHIRMSKGFENTGHSHPEHESIGYVLSGRIEMRIGEEVHILGPGSSWYHPAGVEHTSLALEESEALEFHAPLRRDVLELFGR